MCISAVWGAERFFNIFLLIFNSNYILYYQHLLHSCLVIQKYLIPKFFNHTNSKTSNMHECVTIYQTFHNTTHLHSAFSLSGSAESTKPFVHLGHNIVLAWVPNSSLLLHLSHVHQKNFASCRCDRLFNVPCWERKKSFVWNIIFLNVGYGLDDGGFCRDVWVDNRV